MGKDSSHTGHAGRGRPRPGEEILRGQSEGEGAAGDRIEGVPWRQVSIDDMGLEACAYWTPQICSTDIRCYACHDLEMIVSM